MAQARVFTYTSLAMFAFAANSLLCRVALKHTAIDPASFTFIRIMSGALAMSAIVKARNPSQPLEGNWTSAFALFAYAAAFSFAYVTLTAATGALLLFGAVQLTMIAFGLYKGERLGVRQVSGLVLAFAGLAGLLIPGLSAPPAQGAALMLTAGVAWGVYSSRAKGGGGDALRVTTGNFVRAALFAAGLSFATHTTLSIDKAGVGWAIASGALASGLGYAIWYTALPRLKVTSAATVQLSVPVIAAIGGIAVLGEPLTLRLVIASAVILGGIGFVVAPQRGP